MAAEVVASHSIVLDLTSRTKKEAIRELIERADAFAGLDVDAIERAVLTRESVMTTGFGRGVAIAHGESSDVDRVLVALGLSEQGIEYDAMDGKPVHILFLLVNPADDQAHYLDMLSVLTTILRDDELRDRLRCCTCTDDVEATIRTGLEQYAPER